MSGITPNEGQDYIAEVLYSKTTAPQQLVLGLFVNVAGVLTATSVWANVTQASGSGYAEIALVDGTWSVASSGIATYGATTAWIAGDSWALPVYGYYIRTDEGTPRLKHFEYGPNGLRVMTLSDIYNVDLSSDTETA